MTAVIDNLIAARIIYLLVLPFNKWEAFKEGIIDENGERTDADAESDNWSMLHRLVARLKKILGAFPGGKSAIASIAAAYLLVRECVERELEPELLEDHFSTIISLNEKLSFSTYNFVSDTIHQIYEDGIAIGNTVGSGSVAGMRPSEEPPVRDPNKVKKKVMKRNAVPTIS